MGLRDGATVSEDLVSYVHEMLSTSSFFSTFCSGEADIDMVRDIFGQYYLWRNQFHRWFGVCIVKSPAFGTTLDTPFVLSELTEHIEEEIKGDHHGMALAFLRALGIPDPARIEPLPMTTSYSESFLKRYLDPRRSGSYGGSPQRSSRPVRSKRPPCALRPPPHDLSWHSSNGTPALRKYQRH